MNGIKSISVVSFSMARFFWCVFFFLLFGLVARWQRTFFHFLPLDCHHAIKLCFNCLRFIAVSYVEQFNANKSMEIRVQIENNHICIRVFQCIFCFFFFFGVIVFWLSFDVHLKVSNNNLLAIYTCIE